MKISLISPISGKNQQKSKILNKIYHTSPQFLASYLMLDITNFDLNQIINTNPLLQAAGKIILSLISVFIVRWIDNYFKTKNTKEEK